jgi:hypothetical protein
MERQMMVGPSSVYGGNNMAERRIVEFEPIREIWNKYKLENEVIIRSKFSVSQIIETKSNGNPIYEFKMNNQVEVQDLSIEKTTASNVQPPIIIKPEDLIEEMKFEVMVDKPQIYELDNNSFLFMYAIMNRIWLTSKKDVYGKPIYHIEANVSLTFTSQIHSYTSYTIFYQSFRNQTEQPLQHLT